ncbi:MAG: 2Fe-2S iron-sulfur cluster-binding protein, partial [Deferrisomatales bacterium]
MSWAPVGRVPVTVDGVAVAVPPGATLLQAADAAGVYVPRLCAHPALTARGRCGVCAVEVEGRGVVRACETPVAAGVAVATTTPAARAVRLAAWQRLLAIHPHACLACDQREGCSRSHCPLGVPEAERCCERLGACELQKVAAFLGVPADAPAYLPRGLPAHDEGLFTRHPELCIGCGRCRDACADLAGVGA